MQSLQNVCRQAVIRQSCRISCGSRTCSMGRTKISAKCGRRARPHTPHVRRRWGRADASTAPPRSARLLCETVLRWVRPSADGLQCRAARAQVLSQAHAPHALAHAPHARRRTRRMRWRTHRTRRRRRASDQNAKLAQLGSGRLRDVVRKQHQLTQHTRRAACILRRRRPHERKQSHATRLVQLAC